MTADRISIGVGIVVFILSLLSIGAMLIMGEGSEFDCGQPTDDSTLLSARVHYLDWSVLTFTAYDLERTRSLPPIAISDESKLVCLTRAISEDDMLRPIKSVGHMNGRFLLVGRRRDGSTLEIYADYFQVCSLNEDKCRKNDDETRARISHILESSLW